MDFALRTYLVVSLLVSSSLFATAGALAADAQPLTSCGQLVRGTYYLTGDLDCTGQPGHGVFFQGRGRLELRGFTISNADGDGVEAGSPLEIVGPGAIVNSRGAGVRAVRRTRIDGVTISGNHSDGIQSGTLRLRNSIVRDNQASGVNFGLRARIENSEIVGNGWSGVHGPYFGHGQQRDAAYCFSGTLGLVGSAVTGNGLSPACPAACADVVSCRQPDVDDLSACENSQVEPSPGAWGVCSAD